MKKFLLATLAVLLVAPAQAQVKQSGNVTPTHVSCWVSSGTVRDCGASTSPYPTTFGVLNGTGSDGICVLSDQPTSTGYQRVCLGVTTAGGALISTQNFGTAPAQGVSFNINGTVSPIPLVSGATVSGHGACFNNTTGGLIDCGFAPSTSVLPAGNIFVGNSSNVATAVAMSGDCTIAASGFLTCAIPWTHVTSTPTTLGGYGITDARRKLAGNTSYFVDDINGNDSNTCLAATTTACKTLNGAVAKIQAVDLNNFTVTVSVAAPAVSYAGLSCVQPWVGLGTVIFTGNTGSPTTVPVAGGASPAFDIENGCVVTIQGFSASSTGAIVAQALLNARVNYTNMDFGPTGLADSLQIYSTRGSYVEINGTNTVHGGTTGVQFAQASHRGELRFASGTTTWTADSTYSGSNAAVLFVDSGEIIGTGGAALSAGGHTITGFQYSLINNGLLQWNGHTPPNSTDIPGTGVGSYNYAVQTLSLGGSTSGVVSINPQAAAGTFNFNLPTTAGSSGNCLASAGGGASPMTWTSCATGSGVPQNVLNTQSGDYPIVNTDCGKTINATGAAKTITLPSVAGFATNCVLSVYNASSTRGQILSGFPGAVSAAPNNILWSLDTITVEIVNGAWSIQSYVNRHKITAAITVYVDNTNGADTNDCLATTTSACKTIMGALNYVNTWDGNEQAITISVADGTYTNVITQSGPFHGNPTVALQGDLVTPANCLISITGATAITATNGAILTIGGFKITTTVGNDIFAGNASFITISGAMEYGAASLGHLTSSGASTITVTANYTVSGNAAEHYNANSGSITAGGVTITTSGTPAFSNGWARALNAGAQLNVFSQTYSGTGATGPRFAVSLGGVIFTNQTSGTYFPGNATGTIASGGIIDSLTGGTPTASGSCSVTTQVGGFIGSFVASGSCAGGTYILTFSAAAAHGWACAASDQTTSADFTKVNQTASSTTSATFTATTAGSDVVSFACNYY